MNEIARVVPFIPVPGLPKEFRKMPKWTPQRLAKFQRTMRRKRRERERAKRQDRRKAQASPAGKPIGRPRAGNAVSEALRNASRGRRTDAIGPHTEAIARRSVRVAGEERSDAIVYLRAATERISHATDAELLALLALRRLEGRIK